MTTTLKQIVLFIFYFLTLPKLMAWILTAVYGAADYKIVIMFCDIAFLITYSLKSLLVKKIFNPQDKISFFIYFMLIYVIVIAFLRFMALVLLGE